jgi:hypothetical protein
MLSKPVGNTGLFALNATTGTCVVTTLLAGPSWTTAKLPALKVRIAVTTPAVINFGTNVADNNSDILMPANTVEHFTLASTSTVSYLKLNGGTDGYISITPVA